MGRGRGRKGQGGSEGQRTRETRAYAVGVARRLQEGSSTLGCGQRDRSHLMQLGALFLLYLPVRGVAGDPAVKQAVFVQLVKKIGRAV